jgi:hypothetical protein
LTELCSQVEEVNASVINQKLRVSPILPTGQHIDPPNSLFHNLYRATLKSGEIWAIDTTGAQCGYADPLCPWRDFEQHRSSSINRECKFGYIRHRVFQSSGMFPMRPMVAQKVEKQDLTETLEEKIPAWAQAYGGKLSTILRGSDATFEQAKNRFLDQLEDHLKASMNKLYTPEQIARRNKVVERQLSQNMADPNRQKELEGFLGFMASAIDTPALRGSITHISTT